MPNYTLRISWKDWRSVVHYKELDPFTSPDDRSARETDFDRVRKVFPFPDGGVLFRKEGEDLVEVARVF
jgi:hypothetical protein